MIKVNQIIKFTINWNILKNKTIFALKSIRFNIYWYIDWQ